MLVQHRHARLNALATDIYGRPGNKTVHLIRVPAAERAAQLAPLELIQRGSVEQAHRFIVHDSRRRR